MLGFLAVQLSALALLAGTFGSPRSTRNGYIAHKKGDAFGIPFLFSSGITREVLFPRPVLHPLLAQALAGWQWRLQSGRQTR
jgi:hypothetical protein